MHKYIFWQIENYVINQIISLYLPISQFSVHLPLCNRSNGKLLYWPQIQQTCHNNDILLQSKYLPAGLQKPSSTHNIKLQIVMPSKLPSSLSSQVLPMFIWGHCFDLDFKPDALPDINQQHRGSNHLDNTAQGTLKHQSTNNILQNYHYHFPQSF